MGAKIINSIFFDLPKVNYQIVGIVKVKNDDGEIRHKIGIGTNIDKNVDERQIATFGVNLNIETLIGFLKESNGGKNE